LAGIVRVLSPPQALGQCAGVFRDKLPKATQEATHSTAESARPAAAEKGAAALGAPAAANLYGLQGRAPSLPGTPRNTTRFGLLRKASPAPTGRDRTSIAFTLDRDRPGGLYEVLGEFASRGLNLSKVESRPVKDALWQYIFFLDFEAHAEMPDAKQALDAMR